MSLLLAFIRKEFLQIKRNPIMLFIILVVPVIQLIVLVYAANPVMKEIKVGVVDHDRSLLSTRLTNKILASGYFISAGYFEDQQSASAAMSQRKVDLIIEYPELFQRRVLKGLRPDISLTSDAVNSMKASLASSYVSQIIEQFAAEQNHKFVQTPVELTYSQWYNPLMDHKSFTLPGILAILLTVTSIVLSAMNIVREKEMGNIEQINVTPIHKITFMVGKVVPYGLLGLLQFSIGLITMRFLFGLPIAGSLLMLYFTACLYLLVVLGIGFLISTISNTQSQAMFTTLFFIFIAVLMSGFVTPVASMPSWAQVLNSINPVAYMVSLMQSIILKGATFLDIKGELLILSGMGCFINLLAVLFYRKSVE
ncbi:MAG: ABC transporter permease [Bacteroidales bacterium]